MNSEGDTPTQVFSKTLELQEPVPESLRYVSGGQKYNLAEL